MGESDESTEDEAEPASAAEEDEAGTVSTSDAEEDEDTPDEPEEEGPSREELIAKIDALEAELEDLEAQLADARAERDELTSRLKRKAADFENYKKRQERQREQHASTATERLITRLLDVRDNLKRAANEESEDIAALREGVKMTLAEFDRVLDAEDVAEIEPDPGSEVDPERHEVMLQVDSEHPAGRIEEVYQPGYELAEKVLRPAQVTISDGNDGAEVESEEQSTTDR